MKGPLLVSLLVAVSAANSANVTTTTFGIQSWNMNHINYWIVPGIVAGLAVFIGVILIFLFALC
jgi:uncharacterized BrkB/YihY/UPF0761 family membrane protein